MQRKPITHQAPANHSYRFDHFSIKVMADDLRFSRYALRPGQRLPNISIVNSDGQTSQIYDLYKDKPLLLMTGSITCPMTISALPTLNRLQEQLGDRVNFALLYVREAHPAEHYSQPQTIEEKISNAQDLRNIYDINCPVIIDEIDGPLHQALDVMPNSAHLLGSDGEILFQSLWAGDTPALEKALFQAAQGVPVSQKVSERMLAPFLRGTGYMHDTFNLAGKSSYRELALGAPPIALLARTASLFSFLPEKQRGLAAIVCLTCMVLGAAYAVFGM